MKIYLSVVSNSGLLLVIFRAFLHDIYCEMIGNPCIR